MSTKLYDGLRLTAYAPDPFELTRAITKGMSEVFRELAVRTIARNVARVVDDTEICGSEMGGHLHDHLVRHSESTENATKYTGFYQDPRPWSGPAAHALSRDLVDVTPRGFLQFVWLHGDLADLVGPRRTFYTSRYRRVLDTASLALPGRDLQVTPLLNKQHCAKATYMTKRELAVTYPGGAEDRRSRKHLWTAPGPGGESPAEGVLPRAVAFVDQLRAAGSTRGDVVAVTHRTGILALLSILESRPVTVLVEEARVRKTPDGAVLLYELGRSRFHAAATAEPDC
ncbi:histidine phosphatase family protein [Streptomyces sp. NPDC055036]